MGYAARLKKERSRINRGLTGTSISDNLMGKLEREIRRDTGQAKGRHGICYDVPAYREYPCQMTGKPLLLPAHIKTFRKDDGLLYFKNEKNEDVLVVSPIIKQNEEAKLADERANLKKESDKKITNLEPTQLGE